MGLRLDVRYRLPYHPDGFRRYRLGYQANLELQQAGRLHVPEGLGGGRGLQVAGFAVWSLARIYNLEQTISLDVVQLHIHLVL